MRHAFVIAATLAASVTIHSGSDAAQTERLIPYCFTQNSPIGLGGGLQCHYFTMEQCRATASGLGGQCIENPAWTVQQQKTAQPRKKSRVQ
jgi:hypothetical protein